MQFLYSKLKERGSVTIEVGGVGNSIMVPGSFCLHRKKLLNNIVVRVLGVTVFIIIFDTKQECIKLSCTKLISGVTDIKRFTSCFIYFLYYYYY